MAVSEAINNGAAATFPDAIIVSGATRSTYEIRSILVKPKYAVCRVGASTLVSLPRTLKCVGPASGATVNSSSTAIGSSGTLATLSVTVAVSSP